MPEFGLALIISGIITAIWCRAGISSGRHRCCRLGVLRYSGGAYLYGRCRLHNAHAPSEAPRSGTTEPEPDSSVRPHPPSTVMVVVLADRGQLHNSGRRQHDLL